MFDPCSPWRKLLTCNSDGEISSIESALLENHLRRCARCRQSLDADKALRIIGSIPTERMGVLEAKNFDERVIATLNLARRESPIESLRYWIRERELLAKAQGREFEFKLMMSGGAFVASAFVVILLYIFVHNAKQSSNSLADTYQRRSASRPLPLKKPFRESSASGGGRFLALPSSAHSRKTAKFSNL